VIQAPADQPGREAPQRDLVDERGIAVPAPPRDQYGDDDGDREQQPVGVDLERAERDPAARRAGDAQEG